MKKFIIGLILVALVVAGFFIFKEEKKDSDLTKITVGEVTHSAFYVPQYIAHSLGYFKDEGLDVDIQLTSGADKVTSAVLSGDVEIGFCGSEATIYVYNNGEKDYLVNFAGLTKKDGSFLVSREKIENFTTNDLKGKHILAGREGGMPALTLEWSLNQNGIKNSDVNLDTSIDFASMSGAFIGGTGDFVTMFEPAASALEKQGYGYVVESVGNLGGIVPYTSYNAKKSYIENNPKVIEGFTKALQKGIDYTLSHDAEEIADAITTYFPDTSKNDLIDMINKYKDNDSWFKTTYIEKKDFDHIQEIMKNGGKLDKNAPYDKLVDNTYSKAR